MSFCCFGLSIQHKLIRRSIHRSLKLSIKFVWSASFIVTRIWSSLLLQIEPTILIILSVDNLHFVSQQLYLCQYLLHLKVYFSAYYHCGTSFSSLLRKLMVILHVYIATACLLLLVFFFYCAPRSNLNLLSLISFLAMSSVNIEESKDRLSRLSNGLHSCIVYFLPIDDERLPASYQLAGKSSKHHSQC